MSFDRIKSFLMGAVLILFINPFYLVFVNFIVRKWLAKKNITIYWGLPIAFGVFFFNREYGISWVEGSGDDIPAYVGMYHTNSSIGFLDILSRFIEYPSQNEPLWHLIWWPFINIGINDQVFILLHYLLIFFLFFYSITKVSNQLYSSFLVMGTLLLSLSMLESMAFLWRQQIAFSFYLIGICNYYINKSKLTGIIFLLISCLFHLSSIVFLLLFIEYAVFKKILKKYVLIPALLINIILIQILFDFFKNITFNTGITSVISYADSNLLIENFFFIVNFTFAILLFLINKLYKLKDCQELTILIFITIISLVIFLPNASGIYIRLLYFAYPLCTLLFLQLIIKYHSRYLFIYGWLFFIIFIARISWLMYNNIGVIPHLGMGGVLNPFLGILPILINFLIN